MRLFICLFITCLSFVIQAECQTYFQKVMGGNADDSPKSIQQTSDGGYAIVGNSTSYGAGGSDAYFLKLDSLGNIEWTRTYGRATSEGASKVCQTRDGGYLIAGIYFDEFGDVYLIRTNTFGDTLWTKVLGSSLSVFNSDVAYCAQQLSDGGFIIGGYSDVGSPTFDDALLMKIDSLGNIIWSKTYGSPGSSIAFSLEQTYDGGFILAGHIYYGNELDMYLVKTNANGDTLWTRNFGGPDRDVAYCVTQTPDSGFLVLGYTLSFGAGYWDIYLVKTDHNGNLQWSKTYGTANGEKGFSISKLSDGNFMLTSCLNGSIGLLKIDSNGDTLWSKCYSLAYYFESTPISMNSTTDGGAIMTACTPGINKDILIVKTDSLGNSGCREYFIPLTISNPSTVITSSTSRITSGLITYYDLPTIVASGGAPTVDCLYVGSGEDIHKNLFEMYPIPCNGKLTIRLNETTGNSCIEIFNILGQTVYRKIINQNLENSFDLSSLCSGIYFVKVQTGAICMVGRLEIEK